MQILELLTSAYHCAHLLKTKQHRTVLINLPS